MTLMARLGRAWLGQARRGSAGQGKARGGGHCAPAITLTDDTRGSAWPGAARQGLARHGAAGHGWAWQGGGLRPAHYDEVLNKAWRRKEC